MLGASWKDSSLGSYEVRQCSVKTQLVQKSELVGHPHAFLQGKKNPPPRLVIPLTEPPQVPHGSKSY